ncbi:4'-phosphopantetheinyl transferase family protein [Mucilaginibacter celer]|uniref:4'-phosphopantetheinyl transferase superfamily protein n=1 Tax=Mucilaginibacter celer TaxID=2305508 RepID=A0A494VWL5_9SPHI|nr:4'-phosphopantetheinyl transferase superfamily protein [Mucilaginibacter celer]AYL95863.1 4'-phosphopantetheinyl transferase superfamily protein [Mucilaginibacter celer]
MAGITVDIRYLDVVNWQQDTGCSFNLTDDIDVWRISLEANLHLIPRFLPILEPDEIERASRYYQEKDRNRFAISRAVLRVILGRYINQPARDIRFGIGLNKKPFLANFDKPINYNISHSDKWALIAVSKKPIGVDTEKIDPVFAYADILPDHFNKEETNYIEQNQSHRRFCLLWTRKEATTKLTGQGLDERLKAIPSLNHKHLIANNIINSSKDIALASFELDAGNLATVAYEADNDSELKFWDINLTSI